MRCDDGAAPRILLAGVASAAAAVLLVAAAFVWFFGPGSQQVQSALSDELERMDLPDHWQEVAVSRIGGDGFFGDRGRLEVVMVAPDQPEQVCAELMAAVRAWSGETVQPRQDPSPCDAPVIRRRRAWAVRRVLANVWVAPAGSPPLETEDAELVEQAEAVAIAEDLPAGSRVTVRLTDVTH